MRASRRSIAPRWSPCSSGSRTSASRLGVETLYDAPLLGARSDSLEGFRKEQVEQHLTELPAIRPGDLVEPRREFPGRLQECLRSSIESRFHSRVIRMKKVNSAQR